MKLTIEADTDNQKKLVSIDEENAVTEQIINVLKKNGFTFNNFLGVIEHVKSFYENNGTISTIDTDTARQSRYPQSDTNDRVLKR